MSESGDGTERCPVCGEEGRFYLNCAPGIFFCESCELEFWQEGDEWFCCDTDGDHRRVSVADGGTDVDDTVHSFSNFCLWSAFASASLATTFAMLHTQGILALWATIVITTLLGITAIGFGKMGYELHSLQPAKDRSGDDSTCK